MEGTKKRRCDFTLDRGKYPLPAQSQKGIEVCYPCPKGKENPKAKDAVGKDLKDLKGSGSPLACCRLESLLSIRLDVNFHTEGLADQALVTKA